MRLRLSSAVGLALTVLFLAPNLCVGREGGDVPPYRLGEKLTYDAYYGLIYVGTLKMWVKELVEIDGHETYHVVLRMRTTDTFSKIFRIDDTIETFIDTEKLYPRRFIKKINEGNYHCDEITDFDQENGTAHFKSNLNLSEKEYEIETGTQDSLSLIYHLRTLNYTVGETKKIKVMAEEKLQSFEMKVLRKVRKSIYRGATYGTFHLLIRSKSKVGILRRGRAWMWISDRSEQYMVSLRTKMPFGYLTCVLVKKENTTEKHEETGPTPDKP